MSVRWDLNPETCERPYLELPVAARRSLEAEANKLARPSNGETDATGLTYEVTLTVRGERRTYSVKYDYKRRWKMIHRIIVRCLEAPA